MFDNLLSMFCHFNNLRSILSDFDILPVRYFVFRYYATSIFCLSIFCRYCFLDILSFQYFAFDVFSFDTLRSIVCPFNMLRSMFYHSISCARYSVRRYLAWSVFAIRYYAIRYFAFRYFVRNPAWVAPTPSACRVNICPTSSAWRR